MKVRRTKEASWREVDGEGVILNLESGAYYSLNEVGLKIWRLFDGRHSVEGIKALISQEYDVSLELAGQDVEKLVARLQREKLVEVES